jgi:hypothetical protein
MITGHSFSTKESEKNHAKTIEGDSHEAMGYGKKYGQIP